MVTKIKYVCKNCGNEEELKFNNSNEVPYADDAMIECGWWQDSKGNWYCEECIEECNNE